MTPKHFEPLVQVEERPALLSVAVYIGKTRLIDNMVLGLTQKQDVQAREDRFRWQYRAFSE